MAEKKIDNLAEGNLLTKFWRNGRVIKIGESSHEVLLKQLEAEWDPADGAFPVEVFKREIFNKGTDAFDAGRMARRPSGVVKVFDKSGTFNVGGQPNQRRVTLDVLRNEFDGEEFGE